MFRFFYDYEQYKQAIKIIVHKHTNESLKGRLLTSIFRISEGHSFISSKYCFALSIATVVFSLFAVTAVNIFRSISIISPGLHNILFAYKTKSLAVWKSVWAVKSFCWFSSILFIHLFTGSAVSLECHPLSALSRSLNTWRPHIPLVLIMISIAGLFTFDKSTISLNIWSSAISKSYSCLLPWMSWCRFSYKYISVTVIRDQDTGHTLTKNY